MIKHVEKGTNSVTHMHALMHYPHSHGMLWILQTRTKKHPPPFNAWYSVPLCSASSSYWPLPKWNMSFNLISFSFEWCSLSVLFVLLCKRKKKKLTSGLNCSGVSNLSSVFVLVSGAGLKCFWIKAQTTFICHVDTVCRAVLFWWESLVSSRFRQHWRETIWYTWKKKPDITLPSYLVFTDCVMF